MESVDPRLFYTRNDPDDPRLGERAYSSDKAALEKGQVVLWGYPDDEGIRLNGGRPGAASAPDQIRRFFYRMTPPPKEKYPERFIDLGNLSLQGTLLEKHGQARRLAKKLHWQNCFTVSMGGGHDYGFPDAAGFLDHYASQEPLVINFDAHLDVRPIIPGPHSGTPFRRLLIEFPEQFEFWEIGIQPQCNSAQHVEWAEEKGAKLLFLEEVLAGRPESLGPRPDQSRPCFLSLDLDVFSSKEAPGCSQSFATGLTIEGFLPWLKYILLNFDVKGIGFYEVSPDLDVDDRTSKLAALILFHTLRWQFQRGQE